MKRKEFNTKYGFLVLCFFLLPVLIDQGLKLITSEMQKPIIYSKTMAVFSAFSSLKESPAPEVVLPHMELFVYSVLILCILLVFVSLNFIFVYRHIAIRGLFAFLMGSLVSVVLDQVFYTQYMDNLALITSNSVISFNLASIFCVVSVMILAFTLSLYRKMFFISSNMRTQFLIPNNADQAQFLTKVIFTYGWMYILVFFLACLYFYLGLRIYNLPQNSLSQIKKDIFILGLSCYFSLFIYVYTMAIRLSNRIYGPVHGFQSYIKRVFDDAEKATSFKTRKGDHFKDLEKIAEYIRTRILKKL